MNEMKVHKPAACEVSPASCGGGLPVTSGLPSYNTFSHRVMSSFVDSRLSAAASDSNASLFAALISTSEKNILQ